VQVKAGTAETTLDVIGSKHSYALNWCKPNNDDDDDISHSILYGCAECFSHFVWFLQNCTLNLVSNPPVLHFQFGSELDDMYGFRFSGKNDEAFSLSPAL